MGGAGTVATVPGTGVAPDPPEDYSKLYKIIGDEIATIICKGIYTKKEVTTPKNNCPETNLIENINIMITDSLTKQLKLPDIKENIQTIILGNGDERNPTGLRKYINSLIKVSAGKDKTQIYAFTARILQVLFNKEDILLEQIFNKIDYNNDEDSIIKKIKDKIIEELKNTVNETEPCPLSCKVGKKKKATAAEEPVEEAEEPPVVAPVGPSCPIIRKVLSEQTQLVNSDTCKFIDSAQSVLTDIKTYLGQPEFIEKMQETLEKSIKTVLKDTLANITNSISTSVIDEYTKKFTNSRVIKLQLLYSILSYDLNDENDENNLDDNTLYIAKEFFVNAVKKMKKEKKDGKFINKKTSITLVFNEILVQAIQERSGGDYTGSAVTALTSSIVNSSITGGRRKTGKRRKTEKRRKTGRIRKTGKRKSIRK